MDATSALEKKVGTVSSTGAEESFFDGHQWIGYLTYVKLVRENSGRHQPYLVKAPSDVYRAFARLSECDRERFYGVHLDAQNHVCGVEMISQGTLNSSLIAPRELYKGAILSNAAGVIVVHNHPSGNPAPSADDKAVTTQLLDAGRLLDIPVYDHVIIGDQKYFSFAEAGLL